MTWQLSYHHNRLHKLLLSLPFGSLACAMFQLAHLGNLLHLIITYKMTHLYGHVITFVNFHIRKEQRWYKSQTHLEKEIRSVV